MHFAIKFRLQNISKSLLDQVVGVLAITSGTNADQSVRRTTDPVTSASPRDLTTTTAAALEEERVLQSLMTSEHNVQATCDAAVTAEAAAVSHTSTAADVLASVSSSDASASTTESPPPPFSKRVARNSSSSDDGEVVARSSENGGAELAATPEEEELVLEAAIATCEQHYAEKTLWQRCTLHNLTLVLLRGAAALRCVTVRDVLERRTPSFSALTPKQIRRARMLLQENATFGNSALVDPLLTTVYESHQDKVVEHPSEAAAI
jgi:hypothetical protein